MAISGVFPDLITAVIAFAVTLHLIFLIVFIFAFCLCGGNGEAAAPAVPRACGLSTAAVASLPSLAFRAADFEERVECVVCLSELAEGEAACKLPQCGHLFHVACIDMWFHSQCTCPLCRSAVTPGEPKVANSSVIESAESLPFSANSLKASVGDSSCSSSSPRREEEVVIQIR